MGTKAEQRQREAESHRRANLRLAASEQPAPAPPAPAPSAAPPTTKEATVEDDFATEAPNVLRTERVTLEVTYLPNVGGGTTPRDWSWGPVFTPLRRGESVRVVEEAALDAGWAERLTDDRDTAIREVVAWRYKGEPWFDGSRWHDKCELTTDERLAKWKDKDALPLYSAPQPAKGWLTQEDRRLIEGMMESASAFPPTMHWHSGLSVRETLQVMESLLARSTPPEVVLVEELDWFDGRGVPVPGYDASKVQGALAAAGVPWVVGK